MKVHRPGRILALIGAATLIVGACAPAATPAPATPAPETPEAELNIVFIPKAINNPYFDAAAAGGREAAAALGGTFTQIGPINALPAEQIPFIQDATTKAYSSIVVSATGADEVAPALREAMARGIWVVGYDSSPAAGAYHVFVNQVDFALIGRSMADWACELAPDCAGEIAILSATAVATNQNAWIADMKIALEDPKFANLELVEVVFGNDDPAESTNQTMGLLTKYPDLRVIVAPTTVGILAAAQAVSAQGKTGEVFVTGLGLPNDMRPFVKDGTAPVFGLWSVPDLGILAYHVAALLEKGEITGAPGETFSVPGLNNDQPFTIGPDSVVTLGPPFKFDATNIDEFDF
ncbi:MAG TPA: substrate-binding domain-containing protein [Patescibacteria group bacterium]|nr:substrate-binding domain-containing protein [Patescibacteria group bacterium]